MDRFKTLGAEAQDKIYFIHFNHTNPMLKEGEASKLVREAGYHIAQTGMKL